MNIMIVGVGGQGTLLASRVIGAAAIEAGYDVKVSEVHGMSQRGGSVVTYVRFGEKISSPLIDKGTADVVLAFESLESMRFLDFLKKDGKLIVNTQQIDPMPVITGVEKYPEGIIDTLEKNKVNIFALDAAKIALESGSIRTVNIVLLGALAGLGITGIDKETYLNAVKKCVPSKVIDMNLKAFEIGYERGSSN